MANAYVELQNSITVFFYNFRYIVPALTTIIKIECSLLLETGSLYYTDPVTDKNRQKSKKKYIS